MIGSGRRWGQAVPVGALELATKTFSIARVRNLPPRSASVTTSPVSPPKQPPAAAPPTAGHPRPYASIVWPGGPIALAIVALIVLCFWWSYRRNHSITEDAFVEAHIVNLAPQSVSGHLVRFFVEENDRVEEGQILAEIDTVPYRDQVELARSKVEAAEAELRRQEAALDRLRLEVPHSNRDLPA